MAEFTTVHLMGGLGNQLFQIAAAYSHALRTNTEFIIHLNDNLPKTYFNSLLKALRSRITKKNIHYIIHQEPHFHYNPIPCIEYNTKLVGYFQSSKYFNEHIHEIKELFKIPVEISDYFGKKYAWMFDKYTDKNLILVHARRGDYLKLADIHNPQPPQYYIESAKRISQLVTNPFFILISDDESFWKDVPCFTENNSLVVSEPDSVGAFYLMQQMKYFIISNSTFSWWGAWLSNDNRITIAPSRWFGPMGYQDWQDIYEPSWIVI